MYILREESRFTAPLYLGTTIHYYSFCSYYASVLRLPGCGPKLLRNKDNIRPSNSSPIIRRTKTVVPARTTIWYPHTASVVTTSRSVVPSPFQSIKRGRLTDGCGKIADARIRPVVTEMRTALFSPANTIGRKYGTTLLLLLWILLLSEVASIRFSSTLSALSQNGKSGM